MLEDQVVARRSDAMASVVSECSEWSVLLALSTLPLIFLVLVPVV